MSKTFLPILIGAVPQVVPPETTPNDLKRKIKPIPRKIAQIAVDSRSNLRKKNIKIKSLEITNGNLLGSKNQLVHISKNLSH